MKTKEYKIFKVRIKIQELKKTIKFLEENKSFSLFNAQGALFFKLEQDDSWEEIKKVALAKAKKELEESEGELAKIS